MSVFIHPRRYARASAAIAVIATGGVIGCAWSGGIAGGKSGMNETSLTLRAHLTRQVIDAADDLEVHVTFTNRGSRSLRLNTFLLPYASLVLEAQDAYGNPIAPGSPPLPPVDGGAVLRVPIAPDHSREFVYRGSDYFSSALAPGNYRIRARYTNSRAIVTGEWTGSLHSDWVAFTLRRVAR